MKIQVLRLYKPDGELLEFKVGTFASVPSFTYTDKKPPVRSELQDETMEVKEIHQPFENKPLFAVIYDNGMSAEFFGFPYAILYG